MTRPGMADTAYDVVRGWIEAAEANLGASTSYYLGDVPPGWELLGSGTYRTAEEVPRRSLHLVVDLTPKSSAGSFLPVRPKPVHWLWHAVEATVPVANPASTGLVVEGLLRAMTPADLDAVCAAYAVGGVSAAREVLLALHLETRGVPLAR